MVVPYARVKGSKSMVSVVIDMVGVVTVFVLVDVVATDVEEEGEDKKEDKEEEEDGVMVLIEVVSIAVRVCCGVIVPVDVVAGFSFRFVGLW